MRPGVFRGEARQEAGAGSRAGRPTPNIGDIGEIGFQQFLVGIIERQVPGGIQRSSTSCQQALDQIVVAREQAAVHVSEGDYTCAGQRRTALDPARSEEQTSELQSLMRSSYAV